jgi:hypothetical protein
LEYFVLYTSWYSFTFKLRFTKIKSYLLDLYAVQIRERERERQHCAPLLFPHVGGVGGVEGTDVNFRSLGSCHDPAVTTGNSRLKQDQDKIDKARVGRQIHDYLSLYISDTLLSNCHIVTLSPGDLQPNTALNFLTLDGNEGDGVEQKFWKNHGSRRGCSSGDVLT